MPTWVSDMQRLAKQGDVYRLVAHTEEHGRSWSCVSERVTRSGTRPIHYAPPRFPPQTVHETKADAAEAARQIERGMAEADAFGA